MEIQPSDGKRMQITTVPVKENGKKTVAVIYTMASMEDVYGQMRQINQIFLQQER
ncbi:hypothetical protein GCM10020331_020230 [Ectobacillus funiculus]